MSHTSPISLAREQIHVLEGHLTGVYNGNPDSIHDARVATRRLREILPLVDADMNPALEAHVKRMGRCLGLVRDFDVETALLLRMEERLPATAAVASIARAKLQRSRVKQLRKSIKTLDTLDFAGLVKAMSAMQPSWRERMALTSSPWTTRLRAHTAERALGVRTAVTHATGVYCPRRAHGTRIALKKLRYVVEVAAASGTWRPVRLLKDLRKFQATLGELHDAETLLCTVQNLVSDTDVSARDLELVRQLLEKEIVDQHARHIAKRDAVLAVCDACERFAVEGRGRARLLVAAGSVLAASVAMPAALALAASRAPRGAAPVYKIS